MYSRKAQGCTADAQCCAYHVSMSKDRLDGACTVQCSLQLSMVPPVGQPQGILEDGGLLKDVDCWAGCCDGAQRVSQATRTDLQCGGVTDWLSGLVPAWSRVATLQIGLCRMDDAAGGRREAPVGQSGLRNPAQQCKCCMQVCHCMLQPCLVMVANQHEGGLLPGLELLEHSIQGLHRQGPPHVPEVTCMGHNMSVSNPLDGPLLLLAAFSSSAAVMLPP